MFPLNQNKHEPSSGGEEDEEGERQNRQASLDDASPTMPSDRSAASRRDEIEAADAATAEKRTHGFYYHSLTAINCLLSRDL